MADEQARVVRIPEPFDDFYRQEYRPMVTLAHALTGRWDVAEDLAQEGFRRAHRDGARVSGFEYPGAWMRRVVTNLAMSRSALRVNALRHRRLAQWGHPRGSVPGYACNDSGMSCVVLAWE